MTMKPSPLRIAIFGLGEVGRCLAQALHEAGFELLLCEPQPSAAALDWSKRLNLSLHQQPGTWLAAADWVFSCVTGAVARDLTQQCVPFLHAGAAWADFTTASPDSKRQAAGTAAAQGVRYVDTAIMGAISLTGIRTPLLAAGVGSAELKTILEPAGARLQLIDDGVVGDAASLKLLRSVFTKGLEALSVELLTSAEQLGVREKLYQQLQDIDQTPLRSFIEMLVRTHVVHAQRRAHEVHDAQQALTAQGRPSLVLPGVEARLRATARQLERRPLEASSPTVEQALQWLLQNPPEQTTPSGA